MIRTQIFYCGKKQLAICDEKCEKAWGVIRPNIQLSENPDDVLVLSDNDLNIAPEHNGHWEGGDGKPFHPGDQGHNKWCVRQCERCSIVSLRETNPESKLRDWSKRLYNLPERDESGVDPNSLNIEELKSEEYNYEN
jgi:hypothetical protein